MADQEGINGYSLSRDWFNFCFDNPEKVKPIHSAIYFFAIEHCNRLGWKQKFGFPSQMVMEAIGVKNWRTYSKALNEIVDFGFIEMIEKSKNQYSSNIIAIVKNTKAPTKALDKALSKHSQKQGTKHSQSTVSIDKQVNNKTSKQLNNEEEEPTPTPVRSIKRIVVDYKENERLVNAVLNSRENLFFSQQDLFDKLDDFVEHLTTIDQTAKKEHDFKSHFLNWTRAQKRKSPVKEIDYDKLFEDED